MKMDSVEDVQTGKAFKFAMATLAGLWLAGAAGLAVANIFEDDLSPRVLRTDANAYGQNGVAPGPSKAAPLRAPTSELDPALLRSTDGSDQHF
jgi:hypothetical protein